MGTVLRAVGDFAHAAWRTFRAEHRSGPSGGLNFVDGDFVETFLDLPPSKMEEVISRCRGKRLWGAGVFNFKRCCYAIDCRWYQGSGRKGTAAFGFDDLDRRHFPAALKVTIVK